ncbi:Hypothetical protein CINCED_3A019918 [Cinara cedri]|uniref:Uncharacterized protein n=1 Tax=Cinara cedri TaxID=506608 RepID=A0A5E4MEF9_9HEMI|nr:Hypothetical protein CINCED_3A019918 [Cinara cedri]
MDHNVERYEKQRKTARLHVFERKVLRKIYEPIYGRGIQVYRKRHNQELLDIFKRSSIVNEIKQNSTDSNRSVVNGCYSRIGADSISAATEYAAQQLMLVYKMVIDKTVL